MASTFPCQVPSCDELFSNKRLRTHHFFDIHSQVFYIPEQGPEVAVPRTEGNKIPCPIPACKRKLYSNRRTFNKHMMQSHNLDTPSSLLAVPPQSPSASGPSLASPPASATASAFATAPAALSPAPAPARPSPVHSQALAPGLPGPLVSTGSAQAPVISANPKGNSEYW
jgi:hypothetical protein